MWTEQAPFTRRAACPSQITADAIRQADGHGADEQRVVNIRAAGSTTPPARRWTTTSNVELLYCRLSDVGNCADVVTYHIPCASSTAERETFRRGIDAWVPRVRR